MVNWLKRGITICIVAPIFFILFFYKPELFSLALLFALAWILVIEWPRLQLPLLAILYPIISFLLLINLSYYHHSLFLIMMLLVFAQDTGGYIAGNAFGKHKLAPTISPGKTWEGVAGGFILSGIIFSILTYFSYAQWSLASSLIFFITINISAILGDLFESWLKRRAGIKDSGSILPGHGGLLDRFDSLMGAVICVYILLFLNII